MKWHWIVVHVVCVVACFLQMGSVMEGYIHPTLTNTVVEEKNLKDINFPLIFKICVQPGFNDTAVIEAGYNSTLDYFFGQSAYNSSLYGWAGHTDTSEQLGGVAELLSRISPHTKESVFESVLMENRDFKRMDVSQDAHVRRDRVNFPNNCFTLDITNNKDVKEKGIMKLYILFKEISNVARIDVNIQGASTSCHRDIMDQSFSASGQRIEMKKVGMAYTYNVQIKQNVFVEEDVTKNCRNYPNMEFLSYR